MMTLMNARKASATKRRNVSRRAGVNKASTASTIRKITHSNANDFPNTGKP